jgi:hypothetical protein
MKIDYTSTRITTDVTAPTIAMGIDLSGMNHVMAILSNLYSNPALAVLREYATNARDSHVAAGNKEPILVTTPTNLDPQLTVQDFGVGMSYDDIVKTYSRYGSSTKRDDDEQVGAFGIGSKSAFTIASQFTVTGVKDGERNVVLFSLQEDNTPILQVLHTAPTTAPNGVTVSIPISNPDEMLKTVKAFFYAWRPGTVLVDNKEPANLWSEPDVLHLPGGVYVKPADKNLYSYSRVTTMNVVMGAVVYPVEQHGLERFIHKGATIYVDVPIGAVDLAPSRESLKDSAKTKEAVEEAKARFRFGLQASEDAEKATVQGKEQRAVRCRIWGRRKGIDENNGNWGTQAHAWGLQSIPADKATEHLLVAVLDHATALEVKHVRQYLIVTGCDTEYKQNLVRNRRERWTKEYRQKGRLIVYPAVGDAARYEWFSYGFADSNIASVDYKTFKTEAATLYAKATPSVSTYNCKVGDGSPQCLPLDQVQALAAKRRTIILTTRCWNGFLRGLDDTNLQIQLTGRQSMATAQARFPGWVSEADVRKELEDRAVAALTPEQSAVLATSATINGSLRIALDKLDATKLQDPRLRRVAEQIQSYRTIPAVIKNLRVDTKAAEAEAEWLDKRWPLLSMLNVYVWTPELAAAVEDYVNA